MQGHSRFRARPPAPIGFAQLEWTPLMGRWSFRPRLPLGVPAGIPFAFTVEKIAIGNPATTPGPFHAIQQPTKLDLARMEAMGGVFPKFERRALWSAAIFRSLLPPSPPKLDRPASRPPTRGHPHRADREGVGISPHQDPQMQKSQVERSLQLARSFRPIDLDGWAGTGPKAAGRLSRMKQYLVVSPDSPIPGRPLSPF